MATKVTGELSVTDWNEEPFLERDAGKLTQARVVQELRGDIEGTTKIIWLLAYRPDETADFVGMQQIDGTLDGRSGSFVVSSTGTFDGERAAAAWTIVSGSGAGALSGISGSGSFDAPHGGQATYELSFELE
jgi:hypothetical protein